MHSGAGYFRDPSVRPDPSRWTKVERNQQAFSAFL